MYSPLCKFTYAQRINKPTLTNIRKEIQVKEEGGKCSNSTTASNSHMLLVVISVRQLEVFCCWIQLFPKILQILKKHRITVSKGKSRFKIEFIYRYMSEIILIREIYYFRLKFFSILPPFPQPKETRKGTSQGEMFLSMHYHNNSSPTLTALLNIVGLHNYSPRYNCSPEPPLQL